MFLLAWVPLAQAQPPPEVRIRREQQFVPERVHTGDEPQLRVAPGQPTVVRFDSRVMGVELRRERGEPLVRVDRAEQALIIEPRRELLAHEKLPLQVLVGHDYTTTPLRFQLVSRPGEVDSRVDVEMNPRSPRSPPDTEESANAQGGPLTPLLFSGVLGRTGVKARMFHGDAWGEGLKTQRLMAYQAEHGRAISFLVRNATDGRPWMPLRVVNVSPTGEALMGGARWTVRLEQPIEAGGSGQVVVESVDAPETPVRLLIQEGNGRDVRVEEASR